jgi:hypothetical protein
MGKGLRWIIAAVTLLLVAFWRALPLLAGPTEDPATVAERRGVPGFLRPYFSGSSTEALTEADFPDWIRKRTDFQRWWWNYRISANPEDPAPDITGARLRAWQQLETASSC